MPRIESSVILATLNGIFTRIVLILQVNVIVPYTSKPLPSARLAVVSSADNCALILSGSLLKRCLDNILSVLPLSSKN